MKKLDMCGQACPLPVVEAKKALREEDVVEVLVDNKIATENLEKMAKQLGYEFDCQKENDSLYIVTINKAGVSVCKECEELSFEVSSDYNVIIDTQTMGNGDEALGKTLMKNFIYSLSEQDVLPKKIVFYNEGVKLICEGSESIEDLKKLAAAGVEIYGCGVCLNYYELTDKLAVGEITNMYHIVEMMHEVSKVIKL